MARKRADELWTVDDVAEVLGVARKTADNYLRRWGIEPVAAEPGRSGRNLFPADAIRKAIASRPGPGARTDLK